MAEEEGEFVKKIRKLARCTYDKEGNVETDVPIEFQKVEDVLREAKKEFPSDERFEKYFGSKMIAQECVKCAKEIREWFERWFGKESSEG